MLPAKLIRKVEDVAHGGGTERVDRLGVVADHRQAPASGLECQQWSELIGPRYVISAAAQIGSVDPAFTGEPPVRMKQLCLGTTPVSSLHETQT